jgi:sugar/nucleoside kinase (ribokinase family)
MGKVLHFTPHDAHACIALAREAKRGGSVISIDIDNIFDGIEELLPLVDIFISSAAFPERLVGISDSETALREIKSRYGCAVVGMTLGETGSLLLCDDQLIRTEGFAVPGGCKDTTGAGDSFRVGLLYGLIAGESVRESAKMANAVAALKCRAIGARTSLPTRSELDSFLRERP